MPADIGSLLPEYDRSAVAARKAAVIDGNSPAAGDGARAAGYVTVGAGRDYETLGDALEKAPRDVYAFYLMDPVHQASGLKITRDASIRGFGARDTVLQAADRPEDAAGGVLSIAAGASVYISGVTVRGGRVTEVPRRGGGVSNSGDLVMEDCAIVDNLATYGVGLWTEGRAELRRCVIAGNRGLRRPPADEYGGVDCGGKGAGLRVEVGGFLLVEDSVVAYNVSVSSGGALHVSCESGARLADCVLYGNRAKDRGGAVDSAGGELELLRCTLAGNAAGTKGQAIFHRGMLSISGCLLAGNGAGKAYWHASEKLGDYGGGKFGSNEGNFDDSGSLPRAATGSATYIRFNAGAIRRDYGARGIRLGSFTAP